VAIWENAGLHFIYQWFRKTRAAKEEQNVLIWEQRKSKKTYIQSVKENLPFVNFAVTNSYKTTVSAVWAEVRTFKELERVVLVSPGDQKSDLKV
jgi:hypothetical protein